MKTAALATFIGVLATLSLAAAPPAERASLQRPQLQDRLPRHEDLLVPLPGQRLLMHTTLILPPGKGPFPLAVINHGSTENSYIRARLPMPQYPVATQWFLKHGYAVALPLRPGHGITAGPYFEDQGRCDNANYLKSGLATAYSIEAAVTYLTKLPYVRKTGVVIVGQSAGGWGALALSSRNPVGVGAVINFAGGRGGHADGVPGRNCVPDRLIEAAGEFGRSARVPTLWLYAKNDTYFDPALSGSMFADFRKTGGIGEYHLLQPFGPEGHGAMSSRKAFAQWEPIVSAFLAKHP